MIVSVRLDLSVELHDVSWLEARSFAVEYRPHNQTLL